jgi:hypothetical protein
MTKQKKDKGVSLNRIGETMSLMGMVLSLNLILNSTIKQLGVMIFILSFVLYLYLEKK